jgi:hypothetical protein
MYLSMTLNLRLELEALNLNYQAWHAAVHSKIKIGPLGAVPVSRGALNSPFRGINSLNVSIFCLYGWQGTKHFLRSNFWPHSRQFNAISFRLGGKLFNAGIYNLTFTFCLINSSLATSLLLLSFFF